MKKEVQKFTVFFRFNKKRKTRKILNRALYMKDWFVVCVMSDPTRSMKQ